MRSACDILSSVDTALCEGSGPYWQLATLSHWQHSPDSLESFHEQGPFPTLHPKIKSARSGHSPPLGAGYVAYRMFFVCYMYVGVSLRDPGFLLAGVILEVINSLAFRLIYRRQRRIEIGNNQNN